MKATILLIEDDDRLRRILQLVLQGAGHEVLTAADGQEGIAILQAQQPDVVLTDMKMEPVDGMAVLAFGKKHAPQTPIIMLTAFGTVPTAVLAMKDGAFDYLTKPVDNDELLSILKKALSARQPPTTHAKKFVGASAAIQRVRHNIQIFAASDSSVLISGESGTGKEVAARAIHEASSHPEGAFIRVNCAAIPAELIESELFGHTQGAFTGATSSRKGAFSKADGGTIFLDEIGDLPLALQPKLLHAVDEKTITPVGSNTTKAIQVKILSASNRNLAEMITEKTFRQDLYYRLNRVHLYIPPIREREGDIALLLDYFLNLFCRKLQKTEITFTSESLEILNKYPWPGNVREVKNVIERAILSCDGKNQITPTHLSSSLCRNIHRTKPKELSPSTDLNGREQNLITTVLQDCKWNQSKAARALGITRNTLRYRIKKYGICKSEI
jgi:DNA-binding NtrC family response regulator